MENYLDIMKQNLGITETMEAVQLMEDMIIGFTAVERQPG